jgi:class 3 adenylate cyclase/tetratricopeptide (TPR) repeat protein
MRCAACGTDNRPGRKFCGECGNALALVCAACGGANTPGDKFCGDCGASLTEAAPAEPRAAPTAERKLVTVLFADLVGFATLSESRDAEEVRELLSAYFARCKQLIERYGGTVEKFIGDAVMAVWGTPLANEDDAERAVRTALDLVAAVPELDPALHARAGVLTGEAAVTLGAEGQGMVAGDLVNTASRIQSVAVPDTVLVGETTRRATEAAIAYEDAGTHELKGKTEVVSLSRALRVIAGRAGALRSASLEPPFVGRERELRLVKELFHASADEQRAQLVSVVGIAGVGKTRLSWEFEKYVDGLAEEAWWHRGRCLSYGEGVAYWALAEMVRMRCGISEDEQPASAAEKLARTLDTYVSDPEERAWVEPRLAHLLGLEGGVAGDQENLFSAWRVLFERLAENDPVVLVFEDMQWADAGLVDFLEYLLEWSRSHPIFVLALARPEVAERHPGWGSGKRAVTALYLEPLAQQAMEALLDGLVPGLPEDLRGRILDRAEGVPLYAVETVRMLLDRGLLVQDGNVFRPTGAVETLEVPETLHALVAARLDGLSAEERPLVQDASVLGKLFTKQGLGVLTGLSEAELEPLLASLVRKEVLAIQADPRSPERGHYAFLQDIVKHVAYETISRRDRKEKHLAAARHLSSLWGAEDEDEIVEVVASHYLDAYNAAPDAPDAAEIRGRASDLLVRAGERAASLGAGAEALRAFERAIELTDGRLQQADLHERAGIVAIAATRGDEAAEHFQRAIVLFEAEGATHPAARVTARLGEVNWDRGRLQEALDDMSSALEVLGGEGLDADTAALTAQLARFSFFAGDLERALERVETALDTAEALSLPEVLSQALNTKAVILNARGRRTEAHALLTQALETALEHDKPSSALRAHFNLAEIRGQADRFEDAAESVSTGLTYARRVGSRYWEYALLGQAYPYFVLGRWDEAVAMMEELPQERWSELRIPFFGVACPGVQIAVHRGHPDEAERLVDMLGAFGVSEDIQEQGVHHLGAALVAASRGDHAEALRQAEECLATRALTGMTHEVTKEGFAAALSAALQLGDLERVEDVLGIVESMPFGRRPPSLRAHASRFRGRLAALRDDEPEAEQGFKGAAALFREIPCPFYLAVTQLEHAEWLAGRDRLDDAQPLFSESREIFERLAATPWVERCDAVVAGVSAHAT